MDLSAENDSNKVSTSYLGQFSCSHLIFTWFTHSEPPLDFFFKRWQFRQTVKTEKLRFSLIPGLTLGAEGPTALVTWFTELKVAKLGENVWFFDIFWQIIRYFCLVHEAGCLANMALCGCVCLHRGSSSRVQGLLVSNPRAFSKLRTKTTIKSLEHLSIYGNA